jgi:hypothetical protein
MRLSLRMMLEGDEAGNTQKPGEYLSADRQILRHIMDAERAAVKVGKGQKAITATESLNRRSMRFLIEGDEGEAEGDEPKEKLPPIDIGIFATEVMRIVKNYDTLLDIPTAIVNRAIEFLTTKYDEKTAQAFKEELKNDFDYEPDNNPRSEENKRETPPPSYSIGAIPSGGGGGGGGI